MKSSFAPQLFAYKIPDISEIPDLIASIPENEVHYFFGLLIRATHNSITQIIDPKHIHYAVLLDPTLYHAIEADAKRRIEKLHIQKRLPASFNLEELNYIRTSYTDRLFVELAKQDNPMDRQLILPRHYKS
ncbi:MAG: hypothetical protein ACK4NC_06580 [Candidatus Gracilibacteria bacterium]